MNKIGGFVIFYAIYNFFIKSKKRGKRVEEATVEAVPVSTKKPMTKKKNSTKKTKPKQLEPSDSAQVVAPVKEEPKKRSIPTSPKVNPADSKTSTKKTKPKQLEPSDSKQVAAPVKEEPKKRSIPASQKVNPADSKTSEKKQKDGLLEAFETMQRDDGVKAPNNEPDSDIVDQLNQWKNAYKTYLNRPDNQTEDDEVYLTIGCDFGTSCTKIVVQIAYADERSVAFTVPEYFQMDSHPHLWKTMLYFHPDKGQFFLNFENGAIPLTNLKTSLMQEDKKLLYGGPKINAEAACAAYLGLLLRLVKGWVYQNSKDFFNIDIEKFKINWEINFGIPAAKLDEEQSKNRFKSAFSTASLIAQCDTDVTLSFIKQISSDLDPKNTDINMRPEVVAEALGLIRSEMADVGLYVLLDIGASTLDLCVFNYFHEDGDNTALFESNVELLGVQSEKWIKKIKGKNIEDLKKDLKKAIYTAISSPVIKTKRERCPHHRVWRGEENLRFLIAGGGKESEIHQTQIAELKRIYKKDMKIRDIDFIEAKCPEKLTLNCSNDLYHRLVVAWGLSILKEEAGKYTLPTTAERITRQQPQDVRDRYTGPEQV